MSIKRKIEDYGDIGNDDKEYGKFQKNHELVGTTYEQSFTEMSNSCKTSSIYHGKCVWCKKTVYTDIIVYNAPEKDGTVRSSYVYTERCQHCYNLWNGNPPLEVPQSEGDMEE